jgi:hypothetical protein
MGQHCCWTRRRVLWTSRRPAAPREPHSSRARRARSPRWPVGGLPPPIGPAAGTTLTVAPTPPPPHLPPAAVAPSAAAAATGTGPRRSRTRHRRVDPTGASDMARRRSDPTTSSPCQRRGRPADPMEEWPAGTGSHHTAPVRGEAPEGPAPPGVEVPAPGKVDVVQADQGVLIVQGLRDLDRHVRTVPLLFGRRRLAFALEDEAPALVLLNGQRPIGGGDVVLLDAATSSPFKEEEDAVSVASLMAAQNWKRRRPVMQRHCWRRRLGGLFPDGGL